MSEGRSPNPDSSYARLNRAISAEAELRIKKEEISTLTAKLEESNAEARRQMQHVATVLQKLEEAEHLMLDKTKIIIKLNQEALATEIVIKGYKRVITEQAAQIESLKVDSSRYLEALRMVREDSAQILSEVAGMNAESVASRCFCKAASVIDAAREVKS